MDTIKQGNIAVQAENIFPIIKKFLYSEHEIFLRELIANAVDATTKLQALAMRGAYDEELGDLTIDILIDKAKGTLTIRDRGIGMTAEEVDKYLNQVALSSAREFVEKYQSNVQLIGHFGLGFYSAFMVADKVEVHTRSYQKDAPPVKWTCHGNPEYRIEPTNKKDRGTDVVLYLSDEHREYLEPQRVEEIARKYCGFMPIPIRLGKKSVSREIKENGKTKIVQEEVDNIINDTHPLWKQNPADISDEQYIEFYKKLYPDADKPVFWIHLNIDHPFRLTGILYFPRIHQATDIRRHKIHLYANQVFVTDEVGQIVPEYLTLLHGVIDSPDIPLNVSRSYLQSDPNVRKISSYITRKVVGKLHDIFRQNRQHFEEKWDEMSLFIKYGMLSDEKFYEKAIEFALLKNIDEKYFTLSEYKDFIKDKQKDKDDRYVLIYTTDPVGQHHRKTHRQRPHFILLALPKRPRTPTKHLRRNKRSPRPRPTTTPQRRLRSRHPLHARNLPTPPRHAIHPPYLPTERTADHLHHSRQYQPSPHRQTAPHPQRRKAQTLRPLPARLGHAIPQPARRPTKNRIHPTRTRPDERLNPQITHLGKMPYF